MIIKLLSPKSIEDKILTNYIDYSNLFIAHQSKFLSDMNSRYQNLENGKLVLYFTKETHQDILRKKDYDLNFNLSIENFWNNHGKIEPRRTSLIKIAENTLLPKETARRKISELIKQKVLNKKKRNIGWSPNEQHKQSYDSFIVEEINDMSKLIIFISQKMNLDFSKEILIKELRSRFSFYWFHFMGTQLEYLKLWSKQINDLELVFILMQVTGILAAKAKEKKFSYEDLYKNSNLIKDITNTSISATSISDATGIPRATCVRKLENLVKIKMISQDKITKRYYLIVNTLSEDLISQKIKMSVVKLFSNFFFICLRNIVTKI